MLICEFIIAAYAYLREVQTLGDACVILALYPLCLLFVYVCKSVLGMS